MSSKHRLAISPLGLEHVIHDMITAGHFQTRSRRPGLHCSWHPLVLLYVFAPLVTQTAALYSRSSAKGHLLALCLLAYPQCCYCMGVFVSLAGYTVCSVYIADRGRDHRPPFSCSDSADQRSQQSLQLALFASSSIAATRI